jgi:hypothetical protein
VSRFATFLRMSPRSAVTRVCALGASALLALLALAGCTGSHDGDAVAPVTVPTSARPRPTSSPTPSAALAVAPTLPSELSAPPSADTALAAGRYFLTLLDYAYTTGDDTSFRGFSDPNCDFCNIVLGDIKNQRENGQHSVGGELSITSASSREVNPDEYYTANFTVLQTPSRVLDASGSQVDSGEGGTFSFDIGLYHRNGSWSVAAVGITPKESR